MFKKGNFLCIKFSEKTILSYFLTPIVQRLSETLLNIHQNEIDVNATLYWDYQILIYLPYI